MAARSCSRPARHCSLGWRAIAGSKYDPGRWIATLAGVTPAVLVGRAPLARAPLGRVPLARAPLGRAPLARAGSRPLRLASSNPIGPELAAFLALDLLGLPVQPVYGLADPTSLLDGLRRRTVDLAFLTGPKLHETMSLARAAGGRRPVLDGVARLRRDRCRAILCCRTCQASLRPLPSCGDPCRWVIVSRLMRRLRRPPLSALSRSCRIWSSRRPWRNGDGGPS